MAVDEEVLVALNTAFTGQRGLKRWKPGQLFDYLRDLFMQVLEDFKVEDLPDEMREKIFKRVEQFYNTAVRIIDIPWVPEVVENVIEDWIWNALARELRKLLELE
jgi:hypothetical protein|tara:strand:- start:1426 stop:1740 length:315 start_codon:yes stop_codon:yes gene_type:complete